MVGLSVQASIRIGELRFERFGDKLRICRMYSVGEDRELALIEAKELLKLKLWLNGDL
jgi:hypothetical protein